MRKIVRHEIQLDGVNWEYFTAGKGKTLLLVPAFHSDINRFKPLVDYLSQNFKVILPHLPGISNNQTLGNYSYTANNYARFLNLFVEKMRLQNYLLAGFCLGGVIIIRMLEQKVKQPEHVLIFEGIYDADFIRLQPMYRFIKQAILKLGPKNKLLNSLVDLILHDERALKLYLKFTYSKEKDINKVIKHQIEITKIMATRAYIEVIFDIFHTHFAQENLKFMVPTSLVYNKYDNLIDIKPTIEGMQRLFPNSEILQVDLTQHSPAGAIDIKFVHEMIRPLEEKLLKLKA